MASLEGAACPACGEPLTLTPLRWVVHACNACGGVWADTAAAERVATVVDRELLAVAKNAALHADHEERLSGEIRPSIPNAPARRCPACDGELARTRRGGVTLDVCAEHGTWFDRDELGRVARNLEYERTSSFEVPTRRSTDPEMDPPPSVVFLQSILGE